jgi:hypothetical protein
MTQIRKDRTRRRRAGATLVLSAATGGLLAAAMAGSPIARADDPFTDIANYVTASFTTGGDEYSDAATAFSGGDTNAGLADAVAGFDNIFISPTDYTLLGLIAAGTDADYSGYGDTFSIGEDIFPTTAAEETTAAGDYATYASNDFTAGSSDFQSGDYFLGFDNYLVAGYDDLLAGQAETLAGLFSAGL